MQVPFDDPRMARAQREIDFVRLLRDVPAITESSSSIRPAGAAAGLRFANERDRQPAGSGAGSPLRQDAHRAHVLRAGVLPQRIGTASHHRRALGRRGTGKSRRLKSTSTRSGRRAQARVGRAGYVYVVDENGYLIAHPDMSAVFQKRDLSKLLQLRVAAAASDARDAPTGTAGLHGDQVLTSQATIERLGWRVVAEHPLDEAIVPLRGTIELSAIFFVVGSGAVGDRERLAGSPDGRAIACCSRAQRGSVLASSGTESPSGRATSSRPSARRSTAPPDSSRSRTQPSSRRSRRARASWRRPTRS